MIDPNAGRAKETAGTDSAAPARRRIVPADLGRLLSLGGGVLLWIAAVRWATALVDAPLLIDFPPMYGAGEALLHGQPLYSVPRFVYPPFAALMFAPFSLGTYDAAAFIYSILQVVAPLVAAGILGAALAPRNRLAASGLFAVVLCRSDVYVQSLALYNPSLLFVLPLVLIGLVWSRGRWSTGGVILGLSIAVKPLLVLLAVLPLVRRRYRAVLIAVLAAAVPTLVMLPFIHDTSGLLGLPARILSGTELHGPWEAANVSLQSVGVIHPTWAPVMWVLRTVLLVGVGWLVWRTRTASLTVTAAMMLVGALALTLPVIGSINEVHYCVMALVPCAALATGRLGRTSQVLGLIALVVLAFPTYYLGMSMDDLEPVQLRWGLGSALALAACCFSTPSEPSASDGGRLRPG